MSKKHSHMLTKPHSMIGEDGRRRVMPAGTPCSPTERQVKNMPDIFVLANGHGEVAPASVGAKNYSVGAIKNLAAASEDIEQLRTLLADEKYGRNRKRAIDALTVKITELTAGGSA